MDDGDSDSVRLLMSAGLPADIESPGVVARQFAASRAVLELIWSVSAEVEPRLVDDSGRGVT